MSNNYWKYKNAKSKTFMYVPTQHSDKPVKKSTGRWAYGKGKITTSNNLIKIAQWNVNGIRTSKGDVEKYIQQHRIDILCVNQTKINEEAFDKMPIQIVGFSGYWNFCKVSSGYSGVAVFSKFLPIRMDEDLPQYKHQYQGRLMTLQFQKFYLIAVYVPNSGSQQQRLSYRVNQWDADFKKYCQDLRTKKNVIICGDMNVVRDQKDIHMAAGGDLTQRKMPGCNLQERNNMQSFLKSGWVDTWRDQNPNQIKYTWWNLKIKGRRNGVGWRIDYIIVNQQIKSCITNVVIHEDILGSDHCPVSAIVDLSKIPEQNQLEKTQIKQAKSSNEHQQDDEDKNYNENKKRMDIDQLAHFLDAYQQQQFNQEEWLGNGDDVQQDILDFDQEKYQNALSIFSPIKKQQLVEEIKQNVLQNQSNQILLNNNNNNYSLQQQNLDQQRNAQINQKQEENKQNCQQQKQYKIQANLEKEDKIYIQQQSRKIQQKVDQPQQYQRQGQNQKQKQQQKQNIVLENKC